MTDVPQADIDTTNVVDVNDDMFDVTRYRRRWTLHETGQRVGHLAELLHFLGKSQRKIGHALRVL